METYSFPILSLNELITNLTQTVKVAVSSETEIAKPRFEYLKEIYMALLEHCWKQPRGELLAPLSTALQSLRAAECLEPVQTTMTQFVLIRELLSSVGCRTDPFRHLDFIEPEPRRTRKFLSALLNYIRFSDEEQVLVYRDGPVLTQLSRQAYFKLKDEYENHLREVQSIKEQNTEEQILLEEKQPTNQELQSQAAELEALRDRDQADIQHLAESIEAKQQHKAEVAKEDSTLEIEINYISARLRQSPERVIDSYHALKQEVAKNVATLNEDQRLVRAVVAKNEAMESVSATLTAGQQRLANSDALQTQFKEKSRFSRQTEQKCLELEQVLNTDTIERDSLTAILKKQEDRASRSNKTRETHRLQFEFANRKRKAGREMQRDQLRVLRKNLSEFEQETNDLTEAKKAAEASYHARQNSRVKEFAGVLRQVEAYAERTRGLFATYRVMPWEDSCQ